MLLMTMLDKVYKYIGMTWRDKFDRPYDAYMSLDWKYRKLIVFKMNRLPRIDDV